MGSFDYMKSIANQIHHHLQGAERVIVIPHKNPDGDALGSVSAICDYLVEHNVTPEIFCATPVEEKYTFLNHILSVTNDPSIFSDESIKTIVVVDSGDLGYAGVAQYLKNRSFRIVNIDHHPTNEQYGEWNLVIPTASSTTEIIYHYFKMNSIAITPNRATALLTGLITDTDNFSNPATTIHSLNIASELMLRGGSLKSIKPLTAQNKTLRSLKLWGVVLSRLTRDENTGITYTYLKLSDLEKAGVGESESEGIANFLSNLGQDSVSLILKETEDGKIKGSFRTTSDATDVSLLAKKLGGGGHKKAAGFTIGGTIEEALKKILTKE